MVFSLMIDGSRSLDCRIFGRLRPGQDCQEARCHDPSERKKGRQANVLQIGRGAGPGHYRSRMLIQGDRSCFVKRVPEVGFDRIMLQFKINKDVKDENGWAYTTKTGIYGTDYLMRALVTSIGLGANRPQDAVYP